MRISKCAVLILLRAILTPLHAILTLPRLSQITPD